MATDFNILIVAQRGRLEYEACIFAASLRMSSPNWKGRLIVAEPQPGPRWKDDPRINNPDVRALLEAQGAEIVPLHNEHFGQWYPHGNKIEALKLLPAGEPFVFFDTDTLITGDLTKVPFDFNRPSASNKVEGTWPKLEIYGPGYDEIWRCMYETFDLDYESSIIPGQVFNHWRRHLYFNAGFFYYKDPVEFGERFLRYALEIRHNTPEMVVVQEWDPWLDQAVLPLVIHGLGGGKDTLPAGYLDGETSCHYRFIPLLYARESDHAVKVLEDCLAPNKIKKVVKTYDPIKRMVFQGRGHKARHLFDRDNLPAREQGIRKLLRENGYWMR